MIALTFDDGPGPMTEQILDSLRVHGVKATFFVLGRNIVENPWTTVPGVGLSILKQALLDGHIIGNHTFTHARASQSELEFRREIEMTDSLIQDLCLELGIPWRIPPFRLPFGLRKEDPRLQFIGAIGRPHMHWSSDFNDWHEGVIDGLFPAIISHIEERERMGLNSVLDLHDSGIGGENGYARPATVSAVRMLIEESLKRGWTFFSVPMNH